MKLKYHRFKLKNGVRVVLVPRKETKAVYVEVMFKVGSRYETDDIRGISHFLEHMAFKGTEKRPTYIEINKEMDQYGGIYNAYTGVDVTGYWVNLPADKLEIGIDFLSDIILNSKLESSEIKKEKSVILEEIKLKHDDPQVSSFMKFHNLVFGDTPLGKDIIGTEKTVRGIDRKKLVSFKSKFYKTNNMVLAIGGNIRIERTKKLAQKYFGAIRGTVEDRYEKNQISQDRPEIRIHKRRDVKQAKLVLGFRSFGRNGKDKDRATRSLMSAILGGYTSSRLWSEIREKRGLCYDIGTEVDNFDEVGALEIAGGFDPEKLPEALTQIFKIIRDIKKNGFKARELKMGKNNRIGRISLGLERSGSWASNIAEQMLFEKRVESPEKIMERIKKVKNSEIKKLANQIFQPNNLNMVIVGPIDKRGERKYRKLIKL